MKTNNLRIFKLIAFCALLLGLSGCSSTTAPKVATAQPTAPSWPLRKARLQELKNWQIKGKVAIHSQNDSGSVSLAWTQHHQSYTLSLFGPLGSNAVQIEGKPGLVTLQTADGKHFSAQNPEQLLHEQTGWDLPISSLIYWARGLPVPGSSAETHFDNQHRLLQLRQGDWQIDYSQYTAFQGVELPTRLALNHPQLHIKLVIYQWIV